MRWQFRASPCYGWYHLFSRIKLCRLYRQGANLLAQVGAFRNDGANGTLPVLNPAELHQLQVRYTAVLVELSIRPHFRSSPLWNSIYFLHTNFDIKIEFRFQKGSFFFLVGSHFLSFFVSATQYPRLCMHPCISTTFPYPPIRLKLGDLSNPLGWARRDGGTGSHARGGGCRGYLEAADLAARACRRLGRGSGGVGVYRGKWRV